jgi:hypothetical protein
VTTVFDLAGVLKTRIEGGEPFDVAILTSRSSTSDLERQSAVRSRSEVARVGLA